MNAHTDNISLTSQASHVLALSNQSQVALREAGKIDRRSFTDAIKAFNDYEDEEGHRATAPDRAYSNFTRTVYAAFGLNAKQREAVMNGEAKSRDIFSLRDLRFLQMAESTAAVIIYEGMAARASRKLIKQTVKSECETIGKAHARVANGIFKDIKQ